MTSPRKMRANFYPGWEYRRLRSGRMITYAMRHGIRPEPWEIRVLEWFCTPPHVHRAGPNA